MDKKGKTVLLYSGGTDSWLIRKIAKPDICLYFDIGTNTSKEEIKRLDKDVVIDTTLKGLGQLERSDGSFILPLRNLYFIVRAAEYGDNIILGTNKTDCHNDKTQEFADKVQDLLNYYYGPSKDGLCEIRDMKVDFSYKKYDKPDLVKMYLGNGGSIEEYLNETFSCYTPLQDGSECCNCKPCFNKMMALYINVGANKLPKGYLHKFVNILQDKVDNGHRYFKKDLLEKALEDAKKDI